jgi:tetratricopeptide (TPR) repeat protein
VEDAIISLRQFLALYPKSEFVPAVSFLLATHMKGGQQRNYFEEILQRHSESLFFKAALATLQKEDYDRGNYQDVINRQARIELASQDTVHQVGHRELHLILAESAYYLKQYEQARQEYSVVLAGPDDELSQKAELGNAWCLLQTGKLDSAVAAFTGLQHRLTELNAVHASFGLATAHFTMKQYEEAIQTYPSTPPDSNDADSGSLLARSLYRVGESYFRLQYYTQAIETWENLVKNFAESEFAPEAQFKIADTYFLANHFEEAIAAFAKIRENYSDHPLAAESLLKAAQSKFNAGQYDEAIADFEGFVQEYPDHSSGTAALEGIQLCYYQLGQTDQASEALEKLIAQSPNDVLAADARFRLAQTQLDGSQFEQAIQSFKEILTTYPGTSYAKDAQFALAQAYLQSEDYTQANAELSRFIQYFPKSQKVPEALFQLGIGYFNEQSYLTAVDYFNRIIDEFPNGEFHEPALQNVGWCYYQLGEKDQALQSFNQYLSAFPTSDGHSKVRLQVVKMQVEGGDLQHTIDALKGLQSSHDGEVAGEASHDLGMIYLESQRWQAAKKAFRLAIKNGMQDAHYRLSAISQLAAIYENEEDWQRAVATYQMLTEGSSDAALQKAAEERIQALTPMLSSVKQND